MIPCITFTDSKSIIKLHFGDELDKYCRAFYDEDRLYVIMKASKYDYSKKSFEFYLPDIEKEINGFDYSEYKYIIPLSDLYHELIHSLQYRFGDYNNIDLLESTDDIYTYFITGQWNIDYETEVVALWYLIKNILKLNNVKAYLFVRNSIMDKDFYKNSLLTNENFIRILTSEFDGKIQTFFNKFKKKLYNDDFKDQCYKDLEQIHNLIFYNY